MTPLTVPGVYKNGKVELDEAPAGVPAEARVLVTFLPEGSEPAGARPDEETRRAAAERLIAGMRAGIDFGGRFDREELYEHRKRS
jgi:hypothetical protein